MLNKTFKIGGCLLMIFCTCFLSACSVKIEDAGDHGSVYSREYTKYICSSTNFGGGTTDDMYVVLNYVYQSNGLKAKYGDSFEVSDIGGSTDNQTFMFYQIYKGTGKYFVDINKDEWTVEIAKGYFGKWKVTSCSQKNK
jgi:hypothetical protein